MFRTAVFLVVLALAGCASNTQRIDTLAESVGLTRQVIASEPFRHVVYVKPAPTANLSAPLVMFIDGDGLPWGRDGMRPALDPTTAEPLALNLMIRTSQRAAYISRPCYHELMDPPCQFDVWTGGRYSDQVVTSTAAAIRSLTAQLKAERIVLVGYSGGGVLAVLVAERLESVAAVVTIAANLDTEAWTQHHRYLPLTQSLNPATSERPHAWRELHLRGGKDTVVPGTTLNRYFERYPSAQQRALADYDHACCWVDHWPMLWEQIGRAIE